MTESVDPELLRFATPRYREVLELLIETGSAAEVVRRIGCHRSYPGKALAAVKAQAARQGYAPEASNMQGTAPDGFYIKRHSARFDKEGNPAGGWLISEPLKQHYYDGVRQAIEGIRDDPILIDVPPPPTEVDGDIIPWLQIGDAHIGMLACEQETGANFDIGIGEREICVAAAHLIDRAPMCERMVINDLGDGTHYETFKAMTEASGHSVDFDTRYWKMIRAYRRITQFIVERAMTKAKVVDYIANQGNHSRSNDIWIAELVDAVYSKTGRVNVLNNASSYIAYRMGKTFVLIHHGDKNKPEGVAKVMASDYAVDWGETEFRYIDGGHVHHSQRKELPGCIFESWNNLAPRDKYANDGGWRAKQMMSLVLRSRTYGQLDRFPLPVEKVRDLILASGEAHYVPPVMRAFAA